MDRMIYCNREHAEFPENEFIASVFGAIHKTAHPHNTHGTPVVVAENGFVRLETAGAPYPVHAARSLKGSRVDARGKFESRKVQPRPSPK